ncbi:hypothetical protein HanXRQr2_Chr14g0645221 [Helianthus annuus]|uniref:Uncharacterized protein n=1 Tax=Helianthus annuus TaxID=4232 RepID=A0A9K3E8Z5_HELAN|nr:uncharacterized protein LOC110909163 isoform X1 [Helianthus annuus]XP_022009873.1 uncharacterized protein LOC110909163 isoform X1 [Helianthus annuus]XP_035838697.1 uncharacterized protein LOC110909163 isoform X1 [Helianthus annuus]KAF5769177.1 hypothetical protein HanXRQr2_Chr14g0645221 [Helianthus annuus]KAJ0464258.1 hypothetical protein HanHA300_Chr14g0525091 [Helianthus annuus]KAJ0468726.1 hypothetical protein HanIR_Chr14g0699931 [Helianthus annuus]KAJ0485831.1 hypothetical protein HanH
MSLGDSDKVKPYGQRQQSTAAMLTSLQLAFARETWGWCRRLHENLIRSARIVLDAYSYPKDSEKIMRQTGLARSQIADCRLVYKRTRVHAFGIMVEMYKEEFGDEEVNCESSPEQAASF